MHSTIRIENNPNNLRRVSISDITLEKINCKSMHVIRINSNGIYFSPIYL